MRLLINFFCLSFTFALCAQDQDVGDSRLMKSLYFGGGSYYVDPEQITELYEFIDSIPNALNYTVTIHSHTDNIGGVEYNDWLSRMRSEMVVRILEQKGYPRESLEIRDFGMHNPVYDNSTWEGKLKNRRVDVIFWPMVL